MPRLFSLPFVEMIRTTRPAETERTAAPFCKFDDYKAWVRQSIETLRREQR